MPFQPDGWGIAPQFSGPPPVVLPPQGPSTFTFEQLFEYMKTTPGHPPYEPINTVFLLPQANYKLPVPSHTEEGIKEFYKTIGIENS